jgi:hypothetical protein
MPAARPGRGTLWDMALRPPAARLRPYVRGDYVGYTEWGGSPSRRREFPGPFAVMIFEFGPPIRIFEAGDRRRLSSHRSSPARPASRASPAAVANVAMRIPERLDFWCGSGLSCASSRNLLFVRVRE